MTFPGVYEDYPFDDGDWTCMRIRKNRRIFAWIYPCLLYTSRCV